MSVYFKRRGEAPERFSITNSLTHVATSNPASIVIKGKSYTATITMESGYNTLSVTITMGGVDITASVYSNGIISIAAVTGDIVITAVASSIDYKTWYFNETIPTTSTLARTNVNFTSNGTQFTRLNANQRYASLEINYGSTRVYYTQRWSNSKYRTVVFDSEPTGELRTWLEANATPI